MKTRPAASGWLNRVRWVRVGFLLACLLTLPLLSTAGRAALVPVELQCEWATHPIAVDATPPRLSWVLRDSRNERGARQEAYRVLVASTPDLLRRETGDLWDSDRTASSEQTGVAYAGKTLTAGQRCYWQVRVWDASGRPGPWSRPAEWRMGKLAPTDWHARWIEGPSAETNAGLPLFRMAFRVSRPVRSAIVHVSGLGQFELFLDGHKVGDAFLDPPWSLYERTVYYATHDVTESLRPGDHVFGVMLGKGFYNTVGDRRVHGVNARRPLKLLLEAELEFDNGERQRLVSDGTWRTHPGPITHSAILGGEDYDARRVPVGWDRPGFDDAGWAPARETDGPGGRLIAAFSPPLMMHERFRPVRIDEPQPGRFVYDFGQNASAIPRLWVRGRAGQTIRLTPAEQRHGMTPRRNDGRGLVNPAGVGTPNYFEYILRGDGVEEWQPQFTYTGFQYLQLEGAVPKDRPNPRGLPVVDKLESLHVRNAAAHVGSFACSEPLFNRIDTRIDWAVRANLSHVLTDCPHREKLGWLEVAYLMGPSIAGRYDLTRFYAKVAADCVDSQSADGRVPTVAPAYPAFGGGFAYTPEWGAAAVVVPWQQYVWYGDRAVLAASFPAMAAFVDFMRNTSHDLVPLAGLGDWYDYGHGKPAGASQFTPPELTAMATFYRCARIVADTAGVLGRTAEAGRYRELAEAIATAFNARWFDGRGEYRNAGSPQTANSMALVTGLAPAAQRPAVLDAVVRDLRQRGNQQTAGDIGYAYLLRALAQAGRSDVIHDLAIRTNLGSYGFIVNNGWTAMPEAWDADTGASMNHCMLGHIQEWFLGWVAGIRPDPDSPGFRHFILGPTPVGTLTWARGEYTSVRGRIGTAWHRERGRFELEAIIPPNTTATVILPVAAIDSVRESGRTLDRTPGVSRARVEQGCVRLEAGAGRYRFSAIDGAGR